MKLHHTWHISKLPWTAFHAKRKPHNEPITCLEPELTEALVPAIEAVSAQFPADVRRIHHAACSAFLYTLLSLADSSFPPCSYTLRSTIPIASGLGSSASISVCLAIAILLQTGKVQQTEVQPGNNKITELINDWAFVGELNIHGTPSGLDNTVATLGKAVLYKRNPPPQRASITPMPDFPTLPLLLVNTNQSRSTGVEVAKVGKLKETHPAVTNCILDGIGNITEAVHELISHQSFDAKDVESIRRLGELVSLNQGLLATLGVSHPRLERIREVIDRPEIGWSKLTGGGGGGCAFAVLNPAASRDQLKSAEKTLQEENYARYETLLGGKGVGFLDLSHEDVKTLEITQETIKSATNAPAVEARVGITAASLANHWRFFD